MPSGEFSRIMKDLASIGDTVVISVTKARVLLWMVSLAAIRIEQLPRLFGVSGGVNT